MAFELSIRELFQISNKLIELGIALIFFCLKIKAHEFVNIFVSYFFNFELLSRLWDALLSVNLEVFK